MAIIKPFKAIRPVSNLVSKVAALPYDVVSSKEARNIVKNNPYSFLLIDRPEINFPEEINLYDKKVYEKARDILYKMIEEGIFIQDKEPYLYIYSLIMNGREQTGLVACTSIDDYLNNVIKKHELTRKDKELDRINHIDYCDANTGPIFLTYRKKESIEEIINKYKEEKKPIYNFTADDNVQHIVWIIDNRKIINTLIELFKEIKSLYIADGHHRAASAVKVGLKRRKQFPNYTGEEEFNFFLSVIFPHTHLKILPYNRIIKDLNNLSKEEFLKRISEKFIVEKTGKTPYEPSEKHTFGMFLKDEWYKLTAKKELYEKKDIVNSLDVSILQRNILRPLLGIENPRIDQRIIFVGGIKSTKELEKMVKSGMGVAFVLYPTSIEELLQVADEGKIMPPKSTWFEPKLRSGIFIHKLSD